MKLRNSRIIINEKLWKSKVILNITYKPKKPQNQLPNTTEWQGFIEQTCKLASIIDINYSREIKKIKNEIRVLKGQKEKIEKYSTVNKYMTK